LQRVIGRHGAMEGTHRMLDVLRATARLVRDVGVATDAPLVSRAANAVAGLANEPRWWRCSDPRWWSVQTIWVEGGSDDAESSDGACAALPVQLLVEVVDHGERRVGSIEDWKPQPTDQAFATRDKAFGYVLPGQGPVQVLAYAPPPFGHWEAV
jgi:hypothetical protein